MKKVFLGLFLAGIGVISGFHGIVASDYDTEQHNQDLVLAIKALGKAFEPELVRINNELSVETDTDFVLINQLIAREMPTIKATFSHCFKHDLSENQRVLLMQLLTDLKALTATTTADLFLMAQTRLNPECVERCNKIFEKYVPEPTKMSLANKIAWFRKYENFIRDLM